MMASPGAIESIGLIRDIYNLLNHGAPGPPALDADTKEAQTGFCQNDSNRMVARTMRAEALTRYDGT
jgi:hypothetical protein